MTQQNTIIVSDVCKAFKVYSDKSHTLKEKVLARQRNSFKLNHVLDHVSFSLKAGDAVGLIGHNGSGKSTTLKLLNRILYPDTGSIEMNGKVSSLIELGAGFHPDMTGRENIYINASIFGLKKTEIDRRLDDIIRFSELEEFIDNPVRTYSSGMYMRLAFSIAINVDAEILLIDEILAVGDANFQKKCFNRLQQIKAEGVTIVIVSHSMDQIKSICNRVIWLEKGKIREDGSPEKVCQNYLDSMDQRAADRRKKELQEKGAVNLKEDPTSAFPPSLVNPHFHANAQRAGNMNIRYDTVRLLDAQKKECYSFSIGDDIHISGSITSTNPDTKMNLIIKIFNRYGGHVSTLETRWEGDYYKKISSFELALPNLMLVPGRYYIECAIRDENNYLTDNLMHFIDFTITPEYNDGRDNLGILYIDNTWRLS